MHRPSSVSTIPSEKSLNYFVLRCQHPPQISESMICYAMSDATNIQLLTITKLMYHDEDTMFSECNYSLCKVMTLQSVISVNIPSHLSMSNNAHF